MRVGHRVVSSGVERVTAADAPDAHPQAAPWAPLLDRLERIRRTAGNVSAVVAQHRADKQLVTANQFEQQGLDHGADASLAKPAPIRPHAAVHLSVRVACDNISGMHMPTSLYLAPRDPDAAPSRATLLGVLTELQVSAAALDEARFSAGDGFSRHVVFAGCAPHLVFEPPSDGSLSFCHVALHGPFDRPRLVTGPNTAKPRCPHCRARFDDWRSRLSSWQDSDPGAHCTGCGRDWAPARLDWRGHAIAGRVLIELRNVFPGEASPSDLLLQRLEQATAQPWHYAWAAYLDTVAPR